MLAAVAASARAVAAGGAAAPDANGSLDVNGSDVNGPLDAQAPPTTDADGMLLLRGAASAADIAGLQAAERAAWAR